jgi:prolyl-tRNA editing enzyme YbaK/EbsC (Cys-tRNA(Pro) deacylase)
MRTSVDVHNFLVERDVPHELLTARGRLRSAERIAAVLDLPQAQVGKVVVYESESGPVAALVPSNTEPDPQKVARAMAAGAVRATTSARASQLSEYLSEATPPAGLPLTFRVVMDRALAREEVLYFHGGEATVLLKVRGKDLAKAVGAKVARITPSPGR